jgi:adenylate kinase family enzyme
MVIGCPGSGKTTFATRLAGVLLRCLLGYGDAEQFLATPEAP